MSGHDEGDCSRQSEQQCERHGSQIIKLDRATDKTLAEADRNWLYMDCADEAGWQDIHGGLPVFKALTTLRIQE